MSEIFHQFLTGGRKPISIQIVKISEHAQEPPDTVNSSNIPPISDGWFLTEAQKNVASYQEDGLLWKVKSSREEITKTYERNYKESLDVATKLFGEGLSNLWVVVCSYYSMFYITNAVLYELLILLDIV